MKMEGVHFSEMFVTACLTAENRIMNFYCRENLKLSTLRCVCKHFFKYKCTEIVTEILRIFFSTILDSCQTLLTSTNTVRVLYMFHVEVKEQTS
jgi:hypothetical protein